LAEYEMSMKDLEEVLDEIISRMEDSSLVVQHKAELLAAIDFSYQDNPYNNFKEQEQLLQLWSNIDGPESQLVMGQKYISVHDSMLAFLEAFLTGGLADYVIEHGFCSQPTLENLTVATVSGVVFAIVNIFHNASSLEDDDFCVYLQCVSNFREYKEFTLGDLIEWVPFGKTCNMHNEKWECDYLEQDDKCSMSKERIEKALSNLMSKNILDKRHEDKTDYFKFRW